MCRVEGIDRTICIKRVARNKQKGERQLQTGVAVWFTGLSGAGKSTISRKVEEELKIRLVKVEVLDGDVMRQKLAPDLGFSKQDRFANIVRAAYVAQLLVRNDIVVLAPFISPYRQMREYCRREIGPFVEVYVKCSLEECIRRDVKGLYQLALNGKIKEFTGISDPFEEPLDPDLILETDRETVEESAEKVIQLLERRGFIPSGN